MSSLLTSVSLALGASLVLAGASLAQPQVWELRQNDPDPFCGQTVIEFAAPQSAAVHLRIWQPDSSEVVRTLLEGKIQAGFYSIVWDQLDDDGITVGDASYPYQLLATDVASGETVFEGWLTATVACDPTPVERRSWGAVKARYSGR